MFAALFFVCLFVLSGSLIHSQSDKYMLVLPSNSARIYISPQIYMTDMADYAGACCKGGEEYKGRVMRGGLGQ